MAFSRVPAAERARHAAWCAERQLPEVLALPGFISGRCFRVEDAEGALPGNHVAIYEFAADDPQSVIADVMKIMGAPSGESSMRSGVAGTSFIMWPVTDRTFAPARRGNGTATRDEISGAAASRS